MPDTPTPTIPQGLPSGEGTPPSTRRYAREPSVASEYDATFRDLPLFTYDCRLLTNWFPEPGRLIDFGCGTGRHVAFFAARGFDVTGVDLSPHMLEVCRGKLRKRGLRARLVEADFTRLDPAALGVFDYVLCMFSTLGMIRGREARARCLRSMRDVTRPGGFLALHVHNALYPATKPAGPFWLLGNWMLSLFTKREFGDRVLGNYRSIPNMYLHLFREGELGAALEETGWAPREMVRLNARRDGPVVGGPAPSWRANGFIALAQREG